MSGPKFVKWAIRILMTVSLIAVLLGFGPALLRQVEANLQHVGVVAALARGQGSDLPRIVATNETCDDYVFAAALGIAADGADRPEQSQLTSLAEFEDCLPPGRRDLLTNWTSSLRWKMGEYEQACEGFQQITAGGVLQELAEDSARDSDWEAVERALECLDRSPKSMAISPFVVSSLYYRLGQRYESAGLLDAAKDAYASSAEWYPVVWADPIKRRARLLWDAGRQQEAFEYLAASLAESSDATATFQLWRELGLYFEQLGRQAEAGCAFRNAVALMNQVPEASLPAQERAALISKERALSSYATTPCFANHPFIGSPK